MRMVWRFEIIIGEKVCNHYCPHPSYSFYALHSGDPLPNHPQNVLLGAQAAAVTINFGDLAQLGRY